MSVWKRLIAALCIALLLAGCSSVDALKRQVVPLSFETNLKTSSAGEFKVALGVAASGKLDFPGDTAFNGVMELRDDAGMLIARVYIPALEQIKAGTSIFPDSWRAHLLPGTYRLTWGAPNYGWTTIGFAIREQEGRLTLDESQKTQDLAETPVARGDHGAAYVLLQMAISNLSSHLGLSKSEITVKSFEATVFPDTSLGVPEKSQTYSQVLTPGYVIKLQAQGTIYRYHGTGRYVVYAGDGDVTTSSVGNPESMPAQSAPVPTIDLHAIIPDSAIVLSQKIADLNNDGQMETIALIAYGGSPDRLGYERLDLLVIQSDSSENKVAWQATLAGERVEPPQIEDINGDGFNEVLVTVETDAEGQSLYLVAWQGEAYDFLRPHGGHSNMRDSFGENNVRLQDLDGDGIAEILASHGPVAYNTDVYRWDGNAYVYIHTLQEEG